MYALADYREDERSKSIRHWPISRWHRVAKLGQTARHSVRGNLDSPWQRRQLPAKILATVLQKQTSRGVRTASLASWRNRGASSVNGSKGRPNRDTMATNHEPPALLQRSRPSCSRAHRVVDLNILNSSAPQAVRCGPRPSRLHAYAGRALLYGEGDTRIAGA